jgi:hypothetical protein
MTLRQFDTPAKASARRSPARRTANPEAEAVHAAHHHDPVTGLETAAGGLPQPQAHAEALDRASGGRLARAGQAVLQLQRLHGNRHVQRVLEHALQDRTARQLADDGTRRSAAAEGGEVAASLQGQIDAARANGRPLDRGVGARLGRALGADLSHVRVHTDAKADGLSHALGAHAFTVGGDVFFRANRYRPDTVGGERLLAHELTHVVQQGGQGDAARARLRVAPAGDRHEREADRVARDVAGRTPGREGRGGRARRVTAADRPAGVVQRFAITDVHIKWYETVNATKSGEGATGVIFAEDAQQNRIVLKASTDPIGPTYLANVMHQKVSGAGTVATRDVTADRTDIVFFALDKLRNLTPSDTQTVRQDFRKRTNRIWAYGLAAGRSMKGIARTDQARLMNLLNDPTYLTEIGQMAAVDLFLGNKDRLRSTAGSNLGNWMVDVAGKATVIDNYDLNTQARLTGGQLTYEELLDELAPANIDRTALEMAWSLLREAWYEFTGEEAQGQAPYQQKDIEAMANTIGPHIAAGLRAGRNELVRKLAPAAGKRSRSIKQEVVTRQGGLGQAGWDAIKTRARYLRELKGRQRVPAKTWQQQGRGKRRGWKLV